MSIVWLAPIVLLGTAASDESTLDIREVRAAYGPLWPERVSLDYYLPRDLIYFRYLLVGAKPTDKKRLDLDIDLKLTNSSGEVVFFKNTTNEGEPLLVSRPLWCEAYLPLTESWPPGEYTVSVAVTDNVTAETATFERTIRIKSAEFAVQSVQFYYDSTGKVPAPARAQVGQTLFSRIIITGCESSEGKVEIAQKCKVLDAETKAVVKVTEATVLGKSVLPSSCVTFNGSSGRLLYPGHFILRFSITDRVANKTIRFEIPMCVMDP